MKNIASLATLACFALLAAPVVADDEVMRCGGKLVSNGMTKGQVLDLCGEPQSRSEEEVPQMARRANGTTYQIGTIIVEHWIYNRSSSRFPAHLKFEEGKLVSLQFQHE